MVQIHAALQTPPIVWRTLASGKVPFVLRAHAGRRSRAQLSGIAPLSVDRGPRAAYKHATTPILMLFCRSPPARARIYLTNYVCACVCVLCVPPIYSLANCALAPRPLSPRGIIVTYGRAMRRNDDHYYFNLLPFKFISKQRWRVASAYTHNSCRVVGGCALLNITSDLNVAGFVAFVRGCCEPWCCIGWCLAGERAKPVLRIVRFDSIMSCI